MLILLEYLRKSLYPTIWKGLIINFLFLCVGIIHAEVNKYNEKKFHFSNVYDKYDYFIGYVNKTIEPGENSLKTELVITGVIDSSQKRYSTTGTIKAYLAKDIHLQLGDYILCNARINEVSAPSNPNEFNYKQYLSYQGIFHQVYINEQYSSLVKLPQQQEKLVFWAYNARKYLLQLLDHCNLKPKNNQIAAALLLGYKENIDSETSQNFSGSGAMHVLAVSGLHVGIIYLLFNYLLFFLDRNHHTKLLKSFVILCILWFYAFITGMSPSVSRAVTMLTLYIIGKAFNKNIQVENIILVSAFILLTINPFMIKEVGFQLSYAAVCGIIFIFPILYSSITFSFQSKALTWFADKIFVLIAISIAAQIATFPLSLYYFHQFPLLFIVSNLLVIPIATFALYVGVFMLILYPIPGGIFHYFALVLDWLLSALNYITYMVNSVPGAVLKRIYITVPIVALFYIVIITFYHFLKSKRVYFLYTTLVTFIIITVILTIEDYQSIHRKRITVYNIKKHTVVQFFKGKQSYTFHNCRDVKSQGQMNYIINHHMGFSGISNNIFVDVDSTYTDENIIYRKGILFYGEGKAVIKCLYKPEPLASIKPKFIISCSANDRESPYLTDILRVEDGSCTYPMKNNEERSWNIKKRGAFIFNIP